MSITAKIEDGKITIPPDLAWPSGATVRIELVLPPNAGDMLAEFDGIADDLPPDLAENLDHYLHGHPRRS